MLRVLNKYSSLHFFLAQVVGGSKPHLFVCVNDIHRSATRYLSKSISMAADLERMERETRAILLEKDLK